MLIAGYALFRNIEKLRQNAFFNKIVTLARGLLSGVFSVLKLENKGVFLLHTVFTWLVYYLMDYLAFFAFPETYNLSMTAALGGTHLWRVWYGRAGIGGHWRVSVMVQATLLVYGVSKEAGIAYALVVHGSQTLLVVLMGGISFVLSMVKTGRMARRSSAASLAIATPADVEQEIKSSTAGAGAADRSMARRKAAR